MADPGLSEQWQRLCEEFEGARDAMYRAIGPVIRKQAAIADGRSRDNPTDDELDELDRARGAWDDVRRRMDEFVERHTGIRRRK